jgi:multicomponent Na+:H+ antiporter subunit E
LKQVFLLKSIVQFFLLMGFWLLLSGHYDLFHVSMGVLSSIAIILLNIRLRRYYFYSDEVFKTSPMELSLNYPRFVLFYIPWLIWQIIIASLQVAYVVLHPRMPIDPALIRFKTKLPTMGSKVILGNSITLTPGTITIQIREDEFLVHALMDISSSGIVDGTLPEQVARLYQRKPTEIVSQIKIMKSLKECK